MIDDTTQRLLTHLQRGGTFGYYWAVSTAQDDKGQPLEKVTSWHRATMVPRYPAEQNGHGPRHLYFGVHPVREIPNERKNRKGEVYRPRPEKVRPQIEEIAAVNALYGDFDAKDFGDDKGAALDHIEVGLAEIGVPSPSAMIDSGGGYQPYWLLDAPFILDTPEKRERVRKLQERWVAFIGSDASVHDLPRVLRLPATHNWKYEPAPVTSFVFADFDRLYTLDELEALLPPEEEPAALPQQEPRRASATPAQRDHLRRWVDGRIEAACDVILNAPKGEGSNYRVRGGKIAGGVVHTGIYTEDEIIDQLMVVARKRSTDNETETERNLWQGLGYGKAAKLDPPPFPTDQALIIKDGVGYCPACDAPVRRSQFPYPGTSEPGWYCATCKGQMKWPLAAYTPKHTTKAEDTNDEEEETPTEQPLPPEIEAILLKANRTDAGNAECLAALYGGKLRYDRTRIAWLSWDDSRWQASADSIAHRAMLDTVRHRYRVAPAIQVLEARAALAKHAIMSESTRAIVAALKAATNLECFDTEAAQYDRDHFLAGTSNGTLDLMSCEVRPAHQDDFITKLLGTSYDAAAQAPRWMRFLDEVFVGDASLIAYVQRAVGYTLTGDTREQKLFLCHGSGANGKSVFLDVLSLLWGDYAATASFDTFDASHKTSGVGEDLASLKGARLVTIIETNEDRRLDEAKAKSVTGQDVIKCRFLYGNPMEYRPTFKVWLAMNHKPQIKGTDRGIWRRVRLIPFLATFEGREDKTLRETLIGELPGILNWALAGLRAWHRYGVGSCPVVDAATEKYRDESDQVGQWIHEALVSDPDARTTANQLYQHYRSWSLDRGERFPLTQTSWGRSMVERGYDKTNRAPICYLAIRLRRDNDIDNDIPEGVTVDTVDREISSEGEYKPHFNQENMANCDVQGVKTGESVTVDTVVTVVPEIPHGGIDFSKKYGKTLTTVSTVTEGEKADFWSDVPFARLTNLKSQLRSVNATIQAQAKATCERYGLDYETARHYAQEEPT